jgi:chromosome segregation ATPase
VLARLVHVASPGNSLALEVVAGGKLYQVVVDDDTTAKALLNGGGLTRRVTIIPLNRVREQSFGIPWLNDLMQGPQVSPSSHLDGCVSSLTFNV